jgi:acyl carrier protein
MTKKELEQLIMEALNELNDEFPDDEKIIISSDTILFGEDSQIDSLSLVSLIVNIESKLCSVLDRDLSLTDDRAMTRSESPFLNVQTLKNYILEIVG